VRSPLFGWFNVDNLVAAMTAALARGLTLEEVVRCAATIRPAPGRFEPVANEGGFAVVVDYAHTDDALENVIGFARELVGEGRVITMFGCGGDRDKTKRPKMGRVAARGSDLVVVTSDNPRSEDPMTIIEEILVGVRETQTECVVEVDRRAAIERAIRAARPRDLVLLAGKGHEKTQTFADGAVAFDDVAEAERVLRALQAGVSA
jgi:UDP-N-acetylmuramoyl-L-alanyl-D-glutamate--2,6-diaminopimelate ligase